MEASDLLRGVTVGGVAVLAGWGDLAVWRLFVASALYGGVGAFFYPAYTAVFPDVLPAPAPPGANSLGSISARLARIVGPAIGGGVVDQGGTALAFGLDLARILADRLGPSPVFVLG